MEQVNILGIHFIDTTLKDFTQTVSKRIDQELKTFIITANPEIVMYAQKDKKYKRIMESADYITADGIGIVKAASYLGHPLPERVTGFELMQKLLGVANQNKKKIYLLGAKEEVLLQTVNVIETSYPNIEITGYHHGFFDLNDPSIAEEIKSRRPDLVFVALGFPRQEKWISEHLDSFDKGIFIGIGGSFDVLSGNIKRAPVVWQKLNVEWLYRLVQQPSRWKRMLVLPKFALKVFSVKSKQYGKV
jgi:N-acetylglucosaminyldiphosphoundecaprenol N-acetyl-beta-D-mannosaminyltransferase